MNALFSTVGAFSGSSPKPSLSNALNGLLVAIGYCGSFPDSSCGCIARTLRAGAEAGHRPEIPLLAGRAAVEAHPEKVLVQPLNHRWRCALHNIQRDGRSRRAVPRLVAPFLEKVGIPLREPHDFRQRIPGEFHPDRLQRGRATGGAELRGFHRGGGTWNQLQRGRATGGAELKSGMAAIGQSPPRFNGAAPRGARNCLGTGARSGPARRFNGAAPRGARNSPRASPRVRPSLRFNGAAPRGARNCSSEDVPEVHGAVASTGPRHGGRGIIWFWFRSAGALLASTGPRHGGRGIPGMPPDALGGITRLQRGRATGGAEFEIRGLVITPSQVLQRGRATGGAEFAGRASRGRHIASLQRGRATGGAEFAGAVFVHYRRSPLQRGRATGGAEFHGCSGKSGMGCVRFNGAAPRGARNFKAPDSTAITSAQLQRGRATGGAEFHRVSRVHRVVRLASTGPRHGGRGIRMTPAPCLARPARFNGAAPRGARNYGIALLPAGAVIRFNGAAPRGARNLAHIATAAMTSTRLQRGRATGGAELKLQNISRS